MVPRYTDLETLVFVACFFSSDHVRLLCTNASFNAAVEELSVYRKERVSISVQTYRALVDNGRRGRGLRGMFIGHHISCYPARCRIAVHRENHNNARIVIPVQAGTRQHLVSRIALRAKGDAFDGCRDLLQSPIRYTQISDLISCKLIPLSIKSFLFRSKNVISRVYMRM